MSDLTLSAMLCSRLCHDLVSPIGAINNGLEIVEDDIDEATTQEAMKLISNSAALASAKLRIMRIAFGTIGAIAESVSLEEPKELCESISKATHISVEWVPADNISLDKNIIRLLMNFILIGIESLPRGGFLRIGVRKEGAINLIVSAEGEKARLHAIGGKILQEGGSLNEIEPRMVNFYLTHQIAQQVNTQIHCNIEHESIQIAATI